MLIIACSFAFKTNYKSPSTFIWGSMSPALSSIGDVNVTLHMDLLKKLKKLLVVRRLQGPPLNKSPSMIITAPAKLWSRRCPGRQHTTVNQTMEPRDTATLLSEAYIKSLMGILQIKFMRHTEPQETNKIKTIFFIYNGNNWNNGNNGNKGIMGIIRVQFVVYHEIIYSASLFNRLNGLGFASSFNLLN